MMLSTVDMGFWGVDFEYRTFEPYDKLLFIFVYNRYIDSEFVDIPIDSANTKCSLASHATQVCEARL